jgi:predicted nucleic acid-binding protein
VIVVDTGVVVAMGNRRDDDHHRCTELLTTTLEPLVLPEPLLVEIGYMLGSALERRLKRISFVTSRTAPTPWNR